MTAPAIIPEEAVQAAFDWLLSSSNDVAAARANLIRAEFKAKKVHARIFLRATGSVESRKAQATDHPDYEEAMERVFVAEETWTRLQDQRSKAEAILEAWRTQEASQRAIRQLR